MTVAVGTRSSTAGDGTTTVFTATFRANSASELGVAKVNTTTKVATVQTITTQYTVSLSDAGIPTITFLVAPSVGENVLIYPAATVKQEVAPTPGGPLFGTTVEEGLDRLAAQLQALEDKVGQCLRIPQGDTAIAALGAGSVRINTFLSFNSAGVPTLRPLSDVGL